LRVKTKIDNKNDSWEIVTMRFNSIWITQIYDNEYQFTQDRYSIDQPTMSYTLEEAAANHLQICLAFKE
jgi:hypothetical protein